MVQVKKNHYEFAKYLTKARWNSIWHQLDEVIKLQPQTILEIGPGPGLYKSVLKQLGFHIETLDFAPDLQPDHVGSATDIPLEDNSFDVVCAFQMLEHLPYEESLKAFYEMTRVSRKHIVISLPDSEPVWRYHIKIPKIGSYDFHIRVPFSKVKPHIFDGEHYWEVNKKGCELEKIINDFSSICRLKVTYRVPENPYHRFFVFEQ